MSTLCKDLGSTVVALSEFYGYVPFGDYVLTDPDADPMISVRDDSDQEIIAPTAMTNSAVGKWFYKIVTSLTWRPGRYDVIITAAMGGDPEREVLRNQLILDE